MMLEKGGSYEISVLFENRGVKSDIRFTTLDDHAVISMVENGLGIFFLPEPILKRIPYDIITKPIDVPAYRNIGLAYRNRKLLSLAAERSVGDCERCKDHNRNGTVAHRSSPYDLIILCCSTDIALWYDLY